MSGWLGTLELAGLVGLAAALVAVPAAAGLAALVAAPARRLSPERRSGLWLALAAVPVVVPLLAVFVCLLPSLLAVLGLHHDHCLEHAEHLHLCVSHHAPALALPWALVAAAAAAPLLAALLLGGAGVARARRLRAALALGASGRLAPDVHVVDAAAAFSLAEGLWRPRIHVSAPFARALSPAQLEVVVEHERAHARRRDALRKLAAGALSALHAPRTRRLVMHELGLACEQACDAEASRRVGDPLRVAETLLAAERVLASGPPAPVACGFGDSTLPERVQSLLEGPAVPSSAALPGWLAAAFAVLAALALSDPAHHLAEHLLARLVH